MNKHNIKSIKDFPISSERLGELIMLIDQNIISNNISKKVFEIMVNDNSLSATEIVKEHNWFQINDKKQILFLLFDVISENVVKFNEYVNGKEKLHGYFVGLVIKRNGNVNPSIIDEMLRACLKNN